jgi:hypothetical protein
MGDEQDQGAKPGKDAPKDRGKPGKGKKFGPPGFHAGNLAFEKVAVTSAVPGGQSGNGFLAYLPTWEKVGGGVAIVALVVGGFALMGAGDSTTTETKQVVAGGGQSSSSENPADQSQNVKNGFPTGVPVTDVRCASDPSGDWNYFNGQEPGRHDKFVDINRVCFGRIDPAGPGAGGQQVLDQVGAQFACGEHGDSLVVCSPSSTPIPATPMFVFSARLNGDFPHINTPGEALRVSLFVDTGGDPSTKAQATPTSPNLALAGTNVFREAIFGMGLVSGPPSVTFNAVDRRQPNEFVESAARIRVHGNQVTVIVPEHELGSAFQGWRFGTLAGDSAAGGDAARNNADVAPGGVQAPFHLFMSDLALPPPPGPQLLTTTADTNGSPLGGWALFGLAVSLFGGLVVLNVRQHYVRFADELAPGFGGGEPEPGAWGIGRQPTIDQSAQTLHDQWAEASGSGAKSEYDLGPLKPSSPGTKFPEPKPGEEQPSADNTEVDKPVLPPAEDLSPKPYKPPQDTM